MKLRKVNMFSKKLLTVAGITLPVALIAGCGELIVAETGGAGSCDSSPFTIAATVSEDASTYTVDYTGPSDVSLVLSPGFYVEDSVVDISALFGGTELVPEGSAYFASFGDSYDAASVSLLKFDTTGDGWATSGSGATTTHSFEGSFRTLLGDEWLDDYVFESIMPHLVGVVCDETLTTGRIEDATTTPEGFLDDITIQAAVELIPNHLLLEPLEISNQEPFGNGFAGDARFAAGSDSLFGDFIPVDVAGPSGALMFPDDPSVPNNSFTELWYQAIPFLFVDAGGTLLDLGFPDGVGLDENFPFIIEPAADDPADVPEAGNYLVLMLLVDDGDDPTDARMVFMNTYYDPESGVTFLDPLGEPENPEATDLAATGVDASAIGIGAGTLLAGGVALGAVAAVRRARVKS
jgi:hypothetical protein